ncbi:inositol monophosphatase [Donghicola sp. XS_ASV15]|uniref:inositol monophosphatase family protein n=1 Tax=Donghicola sp. XS_ASV15 TaxID=3241295 RepID=UPI00351333FD
MTADRLGFAVSLARKAGALAQSMRDQAGGLDYTIKAPEDYATDADYAVEALIRQRIAETYPEDGVLGEEDGLQGRVNGCWIVDPIDGTINFSRGMDDWGISIGYFNGTEFELGVIFAPDKNLMASGQAGRGAFVNGKPVTFGQGHPSQTKLISIGYSDRQPMQEYTDRIARIRAAGMDHRRHGAATIGFLGVLSGWFDAYYERALNIWDAAAGLAMIKAAGGVVEHGPFDTFVKEPTRVLAHNGRIPEVGRIVDPAQTQAAE